jgi:hypothetical protein
VGCWLLGERGQCDAQGWVETSGCVEAGGELRGGREEVMARGEGEEDRCCKRGRTLVGNTRKGRGTRTW